MPVNEAYLRASAPPAIQAFMQEDAGRDLPVMEVRNLHFSYGRNKVLRGVSLFVERGKVTTLLGGNGCGKTTLFNLMTKNLTPDKGKVFLRGRNIAQLGLKDFAQKVSIVHQYNTAADDITVGQLVEMGRTPYRKVMTDLGEDDERLVEWAMEVTDISELRDREVSRLSGGQRQRVWIAMALAQNTKVLFLDEPTTYLDIRYQIEVLELVRKLNREYGLTIVMVLHDINQAIHYSDRIVGLKDGRVAVYGSPDEAISRESLKELFDVDLDLAQGSGGTYAMLQPDDAAAGPELFVAGKSDVPVEAALGGGDGDGDGAGDGAGEPEGAGGSGLAGRKEPERSRFAISRVLWTLLGLVTFALGTVGVILPILPTVPFYLAALFCFAKGSQRLHDWFVGTQLYHKHLEGFVDHRGMTMRTKLSIIGMVTLVMAVAFFFMRNLAVGRVILVVVWVAHVVYFMGFVKTEKPGEGGDADDYAAEYDGDPDAFEAGSDGKQDDGNRSAKKGGGMIKTRLISLLSEARVYVIYQVIWQWLALLCQIFTILVVTSVLRDALAGEVNPLLLSVQAVTVAVVLAIRFYCDRRATVNAHRASVDVKRIVREKIYAKLLRLGASYREHVSTAEVVQMSGEGAEQLETYFGKYLSQLFYSILAPLTLFLVLLPYNLPAALVLLVAVPLIPVVIMVVQRIARRLLNRYWDVYTELGDSFLENLQGLTALKVYRADAMKADEMDVESERFRVITMKVLSMQLNSIIVMDAIAYAGAAVGMSVAIWQYMEGNVDFAGTLMIILLASEFFIPMRLLGSFFHIAMNGMAASDKMFAFLDLPEPARGSEALLADEPLDIRLADVRFSYDGTREILGGVSMDLPAGSFTSLVGMSGCGKSTIANLLMGRNTGYGGSISVAGHELGDLTESSLMESLTMVTNKSHLFKGTVRDNLRLGNPNAGTADMQRVLRQVNLDGFLAAQQGLETPVAEDGGNLSGGQRQRLALARALLHDTRGYIFDEATSNIDVESEEVIMQVIHELARTKTVVLISHRLANVVGSDAIYLLEDGRIAEAGTHDELMRADGAYAALYRQQRELECYGREVA